MMNVDVVIIGGGVSGLATAWELNRKGYSTVVLERQVRTGGHAFSENISGFMMEHGPSTINAFDPLAQNVSMRLGLAAKQTYLGNDVKRRYLVKGGTLKAISIHPFGFLMADYMSISGRLRMMMEPFVSRRKSDLEETIEDYITRRFGSEFCERIIDPLVGGLYAGRACELSMSSVFPKMLALEKQYGSVAKGMITKHFKDGKMPGKRLFSWQDGLGSLPKALDAQVENVRTGVTVRAIRKSKIGYQIDCGDQGPLQAKSVVIATQPHVASGLLSTVDVEGAEATNSISTPPLAVVFLGYRREQVSHPLDGLGFLAAEAENIGLTGAQFSSTMFPGRAPKGCVSITSYVGGARHPELARLPENDLIQLARDRLGTLLGIRGEPQVARVRHWHLGLPQYQLGHSAIVQTLEDTGLRNPGLFLTGNYFKGPAVAACLGKAHDTAQSVANFLRTTNRHQLPATAVQACN